MTAPGRLALTALAICCATPACNKLNGDLTGSSAQPAASAPAAVAGTTFTVKVPGKGTSRVGRETTTTQFSMAVLGAGGKVITKMDMKQVEEHNTTEKVLAANGDGPTSIRITYDKSVETETTGPKTKAKKTPVNGKTYLAELKDGRIVVTNADGKKVKKSETKQVQKDEKDLGKADPFDKLLPDHPLKKGEQLKVTNDLAADLMGGSDMKMDVDKFSVTFEGTKQEGSRTEGLFKLHMEVTGYPEPTVGLQMKIDGEITLDTATGWPVSVHLAGPIQVKGDDPKHHVHMDGQGKMEMNASYSY